MDSFFFFHRDFGIINPLSSVAGLISCIAVPVVNQKAIKRNELYHSLYLG